MSDPRATKPKHIVDTHRHPIGPRLSAKMAERGVYDPKKSFPQTNASDIMTYREFMDLAYSMPMQRQGGVTKSIASAGGEVEWVADQILETNVVDTLKFLNDEFLEIRDQYPGEFDLMANAHALEETSRDVIDPMLKRHGAKAVAVASSYGQGSERVFLDSPKAEWLWEYAVANDLLVHVHPPMLAIGREALMQYRLNAAIGRPFDSTVTCSRIIYSGVFDKYPKLKVLIVHMGGDLASILGRLDFNWHLNYNGIENPPVNKVDKNQRKPSDSFKTNVFVDTMGFNPIGVRAAIEMCGIDRVVFGTDYGPVPYGVKEHVDIVDNVVPDVAGREKVLWRTSNELFRLGLED